MASVLMQCPAAARNHRLFSKRSVSASQHVQQQKNKKNVQNAEAALQQHQQCTTITTTVTATTTTTTGSGGGGTTSSSVKLTVKDEVKPRASVRTVRNNSLDSYHHHYQYINIPNIITYKRGRSKIPASARLRSSIAQQQQQDTVSSKGGSKDEPDGTVVQLILNKPMTRRMRNSGGGTAPPQLISAGTGAPGAAATDELNGNGGGISRTLPLSGDDHRNNNGDINLELTSLAATAGTTTTTSTTTIKRNKRSRSSTKIEKEKNDEKGSKVLRKNGGVVAAATSGIPVATSGKSSGETVVSKGVSSESITSAASTPTASLTRNTFSSSSLNRKAAGMAATVKGTGTQEVSSGSNSLKARKK